MTAEIVDLDQWRVEHPPAVRLVNIGLHCWLASWRLWSAWAGLYGPRK